MISRNSFLVSYWRAYGGFDALLKSPYLIIAIILSIVFAPLWLEEVNGKRVWIDLAFSVLPSLLSFSLGALALLIAFSNEVMVRFIQEKGKPDSFL